MKVRLKKILNKEKENTRTNEKYKYTSALCIFDDNATAKWVRVPEYVCEPEKIKVDMVAEVYFSDAEQTQATIFEPVEAKEQIKPSKVDESTGEIIEE